MIKDQEIQNEPFYLLRTPLRPINLLYELNSIAPDQLEAKLQSLFSDPFLHEALYAASPELYSEFEKFMNGSLPPNRRRMKMIRTLYKYAARMTARATPYGLFAGCAVGTIGTHTQLQMGDLTQNYKHRRLDMNYVAELATAVATQPAIRNQLKFFPNNSIYRSQDKLRYVDFSTREKKRYYSIAAVDYSEYLDAILQQAAGGATIAELAAVLVSDEISLAEASGFVDELIASNLLISELEPTVTGDDFLTRFVHRLQQLNGHEPFSQPLARILHLLQQQSSGTEHYKEIEALVSQLMTGSKPKDLVQIDLFHDMQQNAIGQDVLDDITPQIERLFYLTHPHQENDLEAFKKSFYEKYEEREMPLAEVLDPDHGIGYADATAGSVTYTPLVADITPSMPGAAPGKPYIWDSWMHLMMRKYVDAVAQKKTIVTLTDADIDNIAKDRNIVLPAQFYLMGSLVTSDGEPLNKDNYLFSYHNMMGPASCELMGRFCSGSPALTAAVRKVFAEEQANDPDVILAEVSHLPQSRAGNILIRPVLRDYEIPFITPGAVAASHQLPLNDLLVSVRGGEVVLRSKKLNKRIIPKLTTAHNFSRDNLATYKFLCDLQSQGFHNGFFWNWEILENEPFIPRVQYKKIILRKARWLLRRDDFPILAGKERITDTAALADSLAPYNLPDWFTITEGDNELLLCRHNEMSLRLLGEALLKGRSVAVTEFLQTPGHCIVQGKDGSYVHEVVIPYKTKAPQPTYAVYESRTATGEDAAVARSFAPGSAWLYAKWYCGTKSAEELLRNHLAPMLAELKARQLVQKWFFIRFYDPDFHLRLRFYNDTQADAWKAIMEVMNAYTLPLLAQGLLTKVQFDTYNREIERYGANNIALIESLYSYDSDAVLSITGKLQGDAGERYRWLLAMRGIDMLLDDCGFDPAQKLALLKQLQSNFFEEFGGTLVLIRQLNAKYRAAAETISSFMQAGNDESNGITAVVNAFRRRSQQSLPVIETLRQQEGSLDDLLPSIIHMFCNRMFLALPRRHELVVYHYLMRYYKTIQPAENAADV